MVNCSLGPAVVRRSRGSDVESAEEAGSLKSNGRLKKTMPCLAPSKLDQENTLPEKAQFKSWGRFHQPVMAYFFSRGCPGSLCLYIAWGHAMLCYAMLVDLLGHNPKRST